MRILLNGEPRDIAAATLDAALDETGLGAAKVATAVNGAFVPASARHDTPLSEDDRVEVLSPMQGG
jgi:sulfur carrier protein